MSEPAPGPTPDQRRAAGELAQHAFETAGKLRLLAEHMRSLGWRTDGCSVEDLARVADSLGGMSIRAAMASDDADIVSMVMGKPMKRIAPNSHIGLGDRPRWCDRPEGRAGGQALGLIRPAPAPISAPTGIANSVEYLGYAFDATCLHGRSPCLTCLKRSSRSDLREEAKNSR